ncbi:MAG: CHAT domain-containing protein [Saprospiraceae bacterium]|nr:CHAT domain-containing protein [Saprospiraceae bacterium]MCF8251110.1 CHAT domain-containing protein [Saprospiraceae bacterium]MCF8281012.1 CHAT domain-containing protein [Bacteroidales bacterium]MCF8312932.1 CHAT domain-containing protein [Saprospiraceae bacterium]MCF8441369.1 CHAT domain-containing protein [Saprospiraceae bacterium]
MILSYEILSAQTLDTHQFSQLFDSIEILNHSGRYPEAFQLSNDLYQKSLDSFGDKDPLTANACQALAVAYLYDSQFSEAEPLLQKCISIRKALYGNDHVELSTTYNSLATLYSDAGEPQKAVPVLEEALRILKIYYSPGHSSFAQTLNNLGVAYDLLGNPQKAIEMYQQSLAIKLASDNTSPLKISNSYNNIAAVYEYNNELEKAIEYYQISLGLLEDNGMQNSQDYALSLMNLGVVWTHAKNYTKAEKFLLAARESANKVFSETHFKKGFILFNIGINLLETGDHTAAKPLIYEALNIFRANFGEGSYYEMPCFMALGNIQQHWGGPDSSLYYFKTALEIGEQNLGETHAEVIVALNNVGAAYDKLGNFESAIHTFRTAKERHQKKFMENGQAVLPSVDYLDAHVNISNILLGTYLQTRNTEIFQALNDELSKALYIFNELKTGAKDGLTGQVLIGSSYNLFEIALKTALLQDMTKAFGFAELGKANNLLATFAEQKAVKVAGIPSDVLEEEYQLELQTSFLEKQIAIKIDNLDFSNLAVSSHQLDSIKLTLAEFKSKLEKDYPHYYRLKYDLSTASLAYVQDTLLSSSQTLLEYFVGDSSIFIFTVGKGKYDVVEVKKDFPLEDWVKQLQQGLYGYYGKNRTEQNDGLYRQTLIQYANIAPKLYEKLIAPIQDKLTDDLVIVPDGVLGYVPFEALLKEKPAQATNFATYPFLVRDHRISYCYSATLLREMKEKRHKQEPTKSFVAFAPFYEGSYEKAESTVDIRFDTLADGRDTVIIDDVVTRKEFKALPASGEETATAAKLWKGDYFLNSDATEQRFNDVAGDYRIVHLSTHGIADARVGDYSYLAFAEQKDSIENEFLYVRDLYNTQLNADLVVLSACETAQGELQRGEGIISLARAFAYAGAKSIVTTLWTVDDSASKDLTKEFYLQLRKGKTKDAALQSAKMKLVNGKDAKRQHPFFWAGFIGVGDMSDIK